MAGSASQLLSTRFSEIPCLKNRIGNDKGNHPLASSHMCVCTCTHTYKRMHTWTPHREVNCHCGVLELSPTPNLVNNYVECITKEQARVVN